MIKEVLTPYQRSKEDSNDDFIFYLEPRIVHHLDQGFRDRLTQLYKKQIPREAVVLDLMSSWVSHLPENVRYKKVIGHGLNSKELHHNNRLDTFWIQDLNKDQAIPLENASVDFCLIVAGWQYLQYPEELAFELKRVIRQDGKLIISFTNRAFWSKAPRVWVEGNDMDHINYISSILMSQGWSKPEYLYETSKSLFGLPFGTKDPFFSVIATNK